ncbi:RTA1 protein [Diaporthe sp. PMI_573]|nr:RTA1 protein [Diaporthaceae sp. PMI_573]
MSLAARADAAAGENPFKLYHYDPPIIGAVIAVLLFFGTTVLHFWQLIRARCWFVLPLAIGGICTPGRAKGGNRSPNWTLGPYIMQALLLLVAPALYAATIYMQLARIIRLLHGESRVRIPQRWMTKTFVLGDVLSFLLQGGCGGYQASGTLAALNTGAKIIIVGLFVQLLFFGFFIVLAVKFHLSIRRVPTAQSERHSVWKRYMWALYIGSLLVMVRSVFRAVEYMQGFKGYLSHEAYLYIFDAALMFIVMALFNWIHPSEIADLIAREDRDWSIGVLPKYSSHQRLASASA